MFRFNFKDALKCFCIISASCVKSVAQEPKQVPVRWVLCYSGVYSHPFTMVCYSLQEYDQINKVKYCILGNLYIIYYTYPIFCNVKHSLFFSVFASDFCTV
ncbi:hypothetical protein DPEC_G00036120 [Dallia pectoralis]|uniref:Uncharacterized protein n=1 Tax=Dallia pectoralis TaxID=75939 RepID=A0ACC2HE60_DALPE|nr:hypothetical protein DPEC_G00036120 [Dallia pectoralis]